MVPAARAQGSSVADHAASRHDAAYFRDIAVGAGQVRSRDKGNSGVLLREATDSRRISDRRWRQARRRWRALLYRWRRNWRIRRGGKIQKPPPTICVTRQRLRNRASFGLTAGVSFCVAPAAVSGDGIIG